MAKDAKGHGSNAKAEAYAKRQAALSDRMIAAGTHERRPDGNGVVLKRPSEKSAPAASPLKGRGALMHSGEVGGYHHLGKTGRTAKEYEEHLRSSGSPETMSRKRAAKAKNISDVKSTTKNERY